MEKDDADVLGYVEEAGGGVSTAGVDTSSLTVDCLLFLLAGSFLISFAFPFPFLASIGGGGGSAGVVGGGGGGGG